MLVNADFSRSASVRPEAYRWVASPQAGVDRVLLDRVGGEVARATTIVRYAPQSHFPRHRHPGGEEILVLAGTFSDEVRDYPAGWYLRNPPGSSHCPSSAVGTIIFVKLCQMQTTEVSEVRVDTRDPANWVRQGERLVCPLFADDMETVGLQQISPGHSVDAEDHLQAELLVVEGVIEEAGQLYERGSWLRFPAHQRPALLAGDRGATVYVKTTQSKGTSP